ncbi:hypothetical protein [Rhodococcus sp. NPDC055024]
MTPDEHYARAEELLSHAVIDECAERYFQDRDFLVAQAQVHATLAAVHNTRKLDEANAALDKIAEYATPDDAPGWSDADGLLESICNTIESTGRTINYEGDY